MVFKKNNLIFSRGFNIKLCVKVKMSFTEIRKFLKHMQSEDNLRKEVSSSATADDVALIAQKLGYIFSGDDLLRFNGQKVDRVTVRKNDHPGEYH